MYMNHCTNFYTKSWLAQVHLLLPTPLIICPVLVHSWTILYESHYVLFKHVSLFRILDKFYLYVIRQPINTGIRVGSLIANHQECIIFSCSLLILIGASLSELHTDQCPHRLVVSILNHYIPESLCNSSTS